MVASRTGLDSKSIAHAIELGLLSGYERDGRQLVAVESVVQFNARYVPLSVTARKLGTLTQHLFRKCCQQGISLIYLNRSFRSSQQPVMRKEDERKLLA